MKTLTRAYSSAVAQSTSVDESITVHAAAIATTANGEVAFVNFEALLGAICAAVVLEVRRGHHFVALSLAEV